MNNALIEYEISNPHIIIIVYKTEKKFKKINAGRTEMIHGPPV